MKIVVLGNPRYTSENSADVVVARCDHETHETVIDCRADLVTIGIAATVLNNIYTAALKKLKPTHALQIQNTIMEAVNDEKY